MDKITPKPVVPQTVTVKPLDESASKEEIKSDKEKNAANIPPEVEQVKPAQKDEPKIEKKEQKINKPEPKPIKTESSVKEEIPTITSEKSDISEDFEVSEPVKVTDLPLAENIEPLNTITPVEPEPDDVPLFDIVEETKPVESWEDETWKQDMAVNDLSFRVEINEEGLEQVLVEGEIQNTGINSHIVPPFDILILNRNGDILNQKKLHLSTSQLEAGESAPFYTSLVPAPEGIDHIDIRF